MEDPITFDLWGEPVASRRTQALDFLQSNTPHLSHIDMLREYVAALNTHRPMLLAEDLDWQSAQTLRVRAEADFSRVCTYQRGYGPTDLGLHECSTHLLYHSGALGCPVCGGRHLETPTATSP